MSTAPDRGALAMLVSFLRTYPSRTSMVLLALLIAGVLEGLGLSTLLSMLSLATGSAEDPSIPEQAAYRVLEAMGMEAALGNLLAVGIGLIFIKALVVLGANRMVGYAVAQVATDLRLDLIRAIMASRWRYYLSKSVGSLSNAVATEAQRASEGYQHGAVMAAQLANGLVLTVVALLIDWRVSLTAVAVGAFFLGGLNILIRIAGRAGRRQTGLLKSILGAMTDQLGAVKALKAMAREDHVDDLLSEQTRQLNRSLRRQVFSREALKALQEPLLAILAAIGLYILVVHRGMDLAAVMMLIFMLARIVNHLAKAQRSWQNMAISESAFWSLRDAIDEARAEREPPRGHRRPTLETGIAFDRVRFAHAEEPVLADQSFDIPAGTFTVIVGPSGAGKTTLIDLVAGLLHPDSGSVRIDGVALEEIDHRQWRRMIGYVPQEALLVNTTVRANITLQQPDLDDDDVRRALDAANATDFVAAMPGGLDASVGERGARLSGGQRQRLAIARALVHRPRLLILDEATSNLDGQSAAAILDTVEALRGELTLLAVTHDPALARRADRILELSGGRITIRTPDGAEP